jgi:hypothetical protein
MEKDQVTPPLPDRIAAAIDAYAQKSVVCGSRYETGPIAARTALCALIAEVVAERDWLQHHFPEQIAKALGTTSEVTGRTPSMVASCVAKVVAERDAALSNTSLPGYCRLVKERDAATKCADGLAAYLAAAQAKLAEVDRKRQILADIAVEAAGWLAGLAGRPSCSCDPGDLAKRLLSIAAAEQGGA